jgi:addiction module RelE/StbE family toxin
MKYHNHRTIEFRENFKRLTQKNKALEVRLVKKIRQILDNPLIGVPKRHELKHARGSHVDPYVIVYVIKSDTITFIYVDHHNFVYQKAAEILKKLEVEFTG